MRLQLLSPADFEKERKNAKPRKGRDGCREVEEEDEAKEEEKEKEGEEG